MKNEKELIHYFKNKLTRELFIYSIFDEIDNEFIAVKLFKLCCEYRFIESINDTNFLKNYDPVNHDRDFKEYEKSYYTFNKKIIVSDVKKQNIYNILKKKKAISKENLEAKKTLISKKIEINEDKFIDFLEDKFQDYSKYYFYIIDSKLNIQNDFYKNNILYITKFSEEKNIKKIDTLFKSSNIYLNIDLNKDLDYLIKYIEIIKNEYNSHEFNKNNDFYLLDKYQIINKKGLLGDLLFIFDCILFNLKKTWIKEKLINYHETNIKPETINKYSETINDLIYNKEYKNLLLINKKLVNTN